MDLATEPREAAGATATIAAIATPPGRGAIAIVRASGPDVVAIAARVFRTAAPLVPRVATLGTVVAADGSAIDSGLGLLFRAPASATGEDVLELHVHGSTAVARDTLLALLGAGARPAEPGEFTRRAFLCGKLDLSAAEAVGELIDAERTSAARAALGRLSGGLGRAVEEQRAELGAIVEELAASLDFPDEVDAPAAADLRVRVDAIDAALADLETTWERGRIVREGLSVAIVGPPNAGKSSLLNALLGTQRALVSEIAGTTRDTIEESLALGGGVVARAIDTAGLRDASDRIEAAGIARTEAALAEASVALVVVDGSVPLSPEAHAVLERTRARPRVVFFNKRDVGRAGYDERAAAEADALFGSAHDLRDVTLVRDALARHAGSDAVDLARPHLGTARQAAAVIAARRSLALARETLAAGDPVDLVASELTIARATLGELTGRDASESLLDAIFGRFCIGK
jgi:tRNA modification GTPase